MANRRMIYQDMFEDEDLGMLPIPARLLWSGLIAAVADDQGRMLDNASLIKSKVFIFDADITPVQVESWLAMLVDIGMLIRYQVNGKDLLQIRNWWKYQTPSWAAESKYPKPENWIDRIKVHVGNNEVKVVDWDKAGGICKVLPTALPTALPTGQPIGLNDIKYEVNNDIEINVESDSDFEPIKAEKEDFTRPFVEVYSNLTGLKPKGSAAETEMVQKFVKVGITPAEYNQAIQEMQSRGYKIASMRSPETWVLNNHKKPSGNGAKKQSGADVETFRELYRQQKRASA